MPEIKMGYSRSRNGRLWRCLVVVPRNDQGQPPNISGNVWLRLADGSYKEVYRRRIFVVENGDGPGARLMKGWP
jgi:hypothetical protein